MACIHYKFKNSLDFDSITFDGLHISVRDLKESIMQRKKLNDTDMDLLIINALNAKAYKDENEMIPKNASVIVARIPLSDAPKSRGPKTLNAYKEDPKPKGKVLRSIDFNGGKIILQPQVQMPDPTINRDNLSEVADLVTAKGSEEDKIKAMMKQSTKDFDPSNYQKKYPTGTPSPSYVCFKCNKTGHFIHNCPNAAAVSTEASGSPKSTEADIRRIKRPTGIPHTFLTTTVRTEQGAMALGDGRFAVPTIDQEAFKKGKKERPPFLPVPVEEKKKEITVPSVLKCLLCKDLLVDAVVIPCCGNSYCDECIRNYLLEDEDHKCPTCHEENVSPDKLIINQSVRQSVKDFKNEGLYEKPAKQLSPPPPPPPRTTTSTIVIGSPLKLDTSIKTIDLTIEPSTPLQDEKKTPEDVPKGIAVLGGRLPVTIDADKVTSTSSAVSTSSSVSSSPSYRPIESKSTTSIEDYVPPAPIPSLGTTGYRQHGPPVSLPNTALPPPGYRPQLLYPPSLVPPPPGFSVPPGFIPPQISKPLPLSEHEFYRAKHRLLAKPNPLDDYTRPLIDKESKRRSRSKSPKLRRTRSKSPRKRRSLSRSRSRSRTPKDGPRKKSFSRTPPPKKRSYTKSRSRSPFRKKKSYSRSRSRSLRSRGRSRLRSRSLTPRSRSRSWTPKKYRGRSRSYTRSRTRSRSRTPRLRRRTYSRSPPPRRRSFSRSLTPRRRSFSRTPPLRRRSKSPYFRGRARSPGYPGYGRDWSPPPFRGYRSPPPRGFSPSRYGSGPPPFSFGGRNDDYTGRFDPRMYEGIFQDYLARFGLPPPPPPPSGQLERGMYYDPRKGVYRGGTRSRSKSPRSKHRDRSKDRKDDKSFRNKDKKTTDKYKYKNKKDDEKSRIKKDDEKAKFKKDDEKSKTRKDDEKGKTKKDEEKSKHRKEDDKSRGKEEKTKDKENKSKKPDEKGGPAGRSEKLKETEQKPVEKKLVKKVTKVKSKDDGTMAKKESIALRLKTKAGIGKSPMKMGKPKIVKKENESTNAALQAINRTGALKTIATTDNISTLPPKENIHAKRKNSNLIEINTQEVLPEVCDLQKSNMAEKDEEPMETDDNQNVAPEINEVNNKDVLDETKNVTKEETKNGTKEVQPVDKRSEVPQKVKVTKKIKKVKKLVDIEASQSDSASDLEKAKVKRKKRAQEINENDEKTQDESPTKRLNQESVDEKELLQNGISSKGSHEGQLMLSPPELSKWERDDYNEDKSPDLREKLKKKTEKKTLPRSIIESAEKAITQKQPKPTSVVASAVVPARPQKKLSVHDRLQKSPIRQTEENLKKSPVRNDINKQSAVRQRRVYMDDNKQKNKEREEDENRKVRNRESSMQITISSEKKDDDLDRKLKIDRVQRRVSESEKSDRHKEFVNDKHNKYSESEKSDKSSKRKFSERDDSPEKETRQKNSSKEKVKTNSNERESKDKKKEGKNTEKSKIKEKEDSVIGDDKNLDAKKTVNGPEKENSKSEIETEEPPVKKKRYERKESIVDESTFVPDYNEHSDSEGGSDGGESSASHANEEEEKKHKKHKKEKKHKKNKKHKHKHKKKKHKKHKEEKESVDKGE